MEKERPLISVIVPIYNAESFLAATVSDICSQTYENLEILLVDDGSVDGSLQLCHALAAGDSRIRVLHKDNGGASTARNLGIREASGRLLGFVDSDDHIEPEMYSRLCEAYEDQARKLGRADFLVQAGRTEEDEEGKRLPPVLTTPPMAVFEEAEAFIRSLLMYTGDASFCTKLVPKTCFERHLFPEGVLGEDFYLHIEMLPEIAGVLRIPYDGYRVVHRRGSATRRAAADHFSRAYIDIIRHADYVERETCRHFPGLKAPALRFGLYERLDYMLHVPIAEMNRDNEFYQQVCAYLRRNFGKMLRTSGLSLKNKVYLTLLTAAPVTVRRVHRKLKGGRLQ